MLYFFNNDDECKHKMHNINFFKEFGLHNLYIANSAQNLTYDILIVTGKE